MTTSRERPVLHWPEYAIEAWALGTFMLAACAASTWLFALNSPLPYTLVSRSMRLPIMAAAMGLTLVGLVYSPWGRRSGAHMNPAFTLTFVVLGKVAVHDAIGYVVAQFVGGAAGVVIAAQLLAPEIAAPTVNYAVTVPGAFGIGGALAGEFLISFALMLLVLVSGASERWSRSTGWLAGIALGLFVLLESPLSGTSMNPARTVASALSAHRWTALWIYFLAPPLGMLSAAALYAWRRGARAAPCGKLVHATPCLFCDHVREAGGA